MLLPLAKTASLQEAAIQPKPYTIATAFCLQQLWLLSTASEAILTSEGQLLHLGSNTRAIFTRPLGSAGDQSAEPH